MKFQDLKERLRHEVIDHNRRGTTQDFCDILEYDDPSEVSAALAALEEDGVLELVDTRTRYREDGGAIIQGVYGISAVKLTERIMEKVEEADEEYVKKYKLNKKEVKKDHSLLRRQMLSKINDVRKMRTRNL